MIRKLNSGQMPPREMPRDQAAIDLLVRTLETNLDRAAARTDRVGNRPFQRVNRAEYTRLIESQFFFPITNLVLEYGILQIQFLPVIPPIDP